jgi:hypothetical protein
MPETVEQTQYRRPTWEEDDKKPETVEQTQYRCPAWEEDDKNQDTAQQTQYRCPAWEEDDKNQGTAEQASPVDNQSERIPVTDTRYACFNKTMWSHHQKVICWCFQMNGDVGF